MKKGYLIAGAIIVVIAIWFTVTYNGIIPKNNAVNSQWEMSNQFIKKELTLFLI